MAEQFADHHLNIPRLSTLGTDNSDLFHPQAANKSDQAQLPKELACAGVQAGKADFWPNRSL